MLRINPIKLFTVLLILSLGSGFAVKRFLSSNYLNNYIAKKLLVVSSQNTQFNYKDFQVFVSKSHFLPTLILQVNEVSFFVPDKCRTQVNILAKKVLSPVNITSALWHRENIRLKLELENVLVERKKYECKNKANNKKSSEDKATSQSDILKRYIESGVKRIPRLKYLSYKLAKRLKNIKVNSLKYSDLTGEEKLSKLNMNFEKLSMKFSPGVINLTSIANWPYHKILGNNLQIPVFRFLVRDEAISLKVLAKVREGHISFDAKANGGNKFVSIDTRAKQVPLGESVKIFRNVAGLDINYTSALSWLNCHLRIDGTVEEIFSMSQKINQCQVVGELGEWNLSPYNLKLAALNMQSEPIHLSIKKARIKKIINFLGIKNQFSRVKKFGLFTGNFSWQPINKSWKSSGVIRHAELEIENKKRKVKQLVKSVNFEANGVKEDYFVRAKQFELQNAKLEGELDYNYNHNDRVGKLNGSLNYLAFGKDAQEALWSAETEFYQGDFKGVVKGDKYSLSGKLYSKAFKNDFVSSGPYEASIRVTDGSVGGNVVFSSLNFSSKIFDIKNLNFERVMSKESLSDLTVNKLHLDFEADSESLIWKLSNFKNRAANPSIVFTSFGTINNINIYSQLDFFIPKKAITWVWKGAVEDYRLNLLKPYQGVLKTTSNNSAVRDVIAKSKINTKLEPSGIRNKIIKKAREILPIKDN